MGEARGSWRARVALFLQRLVVALAIVFFCSVIFLWWALRTGKAVEFLRTEIVEQARLYCGVELAFESLKLDAIPPVVHLSGVIVDEERARFAAVEQASVALEVLPLLYGRIQIDRASLVGPAATIRVGDAAVQNLPRCLQPDPKAKKTVPIVLGVKELEVKRASLELEVAGRLDAKVERVDLSLISGRAGGADLSREVRGATVAFTGSATVPISRISLAAHVAGALTNPRAISVESLEIDAGPARAKLGGSIDLVGPVFESKLQATLSLEALRALLPELPSMKGEISVDGAIAGTIAEPRGVAVVTAKGVVVDGMALGDELVVDAKASLAGVELRTIELKLGEGRVKGTANLALPSAALTADLAITELPFGRFMACLDVPGAWVDWSASGRVKASGALSPFALGGEVDVSLDRFRVWDRGWDRPETRGPNATSYLMLGFPTIAVAGRWDADPDGFWIRDARMTRGTSTGTATARINIEDADGIDVRAVLEPMDLADLGPVGGVELLGKGRVELRIFGPRSDLRGKGELSLAGVHVAGVPLGDATSSASWHEYTVKLPDLSAQLLRTKYRSDTTLDFDPSFVLTARGTIDDGRLEDLLVPLEFDPEEWGRPTGAMVGEFDVKGPIRHLDGTVRGALEAMTLVDESLDRGRVEMRFDQGALAFDRIDLDKRGAKIAGTARVDPNSGALAVKLKSEGMTLQKIDALRASTPELDGPLEVDLDLGGTTQSFTGTLAVDLGEGLAGGHRIAPGRLRGIFQGREMDVSGALAGGALEVQSTVAWKKGLPYTARLRLAPDDLWALAGGLSGEPGWRGSAAGSADLEGSLVAWRDSRGTIAVESARFELGDKLSIELADGARLGLAERTLNAKRVALVSPSSTLRGTASGKLGATTDLRVQGKLDLAILPRFFPQVELSGGTLSVDMVLAGQGGEIELLGTGGVERGMLEWRGLPGRLTSGTAELSFSRSTVLIERAEGRYADGVVTAVGDVELRRMTPERLRLETRVDAIRPRFTYPKFDLTGTLTGTMLLEGVFGDLRLSGQLAASRSILRPKVDPSALTNDPAARLAPQVYDPEKETLGFELGMSLSADDPLKVKDDTGEVDLYGEVTMTGTNQRVGMLGALAVGRGRVGFIGREYVVESGTIELRDRYSFQPRFDMELSARACDAEIKLALVGTLDSFTTSYQSKPEMEDSNIISCLARGIRVRDLENIRGDAVGSSAASLAGEALWRLSGVDQEVRKVIPVDQIEVTTEYSARDRVYEPRILLAKELGEGKFRLEYSSSLVKNDEQRAAVRYRISPALTLQYTWATSDDITVGDHGVDLKYRWEW